ncbi:MAG: Hsp20/alpha crystallin family protein [Chloroflexota bacterium]|nr:MAG: Hsp20/alpha crystallin family protein [Chloroflexota bacterium]
MAITDLIPWKKEESEVTVQRKQEDEVILDLRDQMNRLFDNFFEQPFGLTPFAGRATFLKEFSPFLDVSETDKEITISAELPGLDPEDIHITLERNTLTISGEKRAEKEEQGERYFRIERSYGSFHRSIPLPGDVDEDKIDATFKRGVLKVKLPKTPEAQTKSKHINIKTK